MSTPSLLSETRWKLLLLSLRLSQPSDLESPTRHSASNDVVVVSAASTLILKLRNIVSILSMFNGVCGANVKFMGQADMVESEGGTLSSD
ncbi:hypothetical protein QVD17_32598 [Tagetes erecta]|uniref:Uncharacterized protein n=1 Tax=Tagetes erecta TaxID=13708 RepID=A0AAD8JXU7_TARER|nr:hypothetical protein QVD17_32598 [Tagetes erecta]